MISQILPYLVGATSMVRVSESGSCSELDEEGLLSCKQDPIGSIVPESIELSLPKNMRPHDILNMLSYACTKHQALLEVSGMSFAGGMYSAVVWICTRHDSFRAMVTVRKNNLIFILPPKS